MCNYKIMMAVMALALAALACNLPGPSGTAVTPTQEGAAPTAKPGEPTATAAPVATTKPDAAATATTAPTQGPTATAEQVVPDLYNFNYQGFNLEWPDGFFGGAAGKISPAEMNDPQGTGWTGPIPEAYQIDFNGYPITNPSHAPQILIYPIKEFKSVNAPSGDIAAKLGAILTANQVSGKSLPFLPMWNAGQVFTERADLLAFSNGRGVRYLTCYAQAIVPIDSACVFYTFQGLSADGKYYISVIYPLKLASIDSAESKAKFEASMNDGTKYEAYLKEMRGLIASARAEDFTPSLAALDKIVQSAVVAPTVALKAPVVPAVDCPGALATRLQKDMLVRVTYTDGTPLRLRDGPSKTSKTLLTIPEGGTMSITGGPQCTDKGIWWQVKVTKGGNTGWVLEGENGVYYIELAP